RWRPKAYGRECSMPMRERATPYSVKRTRVEIIGTVASYAISDEQWARKKVLDNEQRTAVNRDHMHIKIIVVLLIGLALVSVHPAEAQQTIYRVGVLMLGSADIAEIKG